ncbi:MAG: hypothetical protein IT539_12970 [Bradyrhizobiaceae bacterium]|nr:hypothetical protein [Bradyrhizobiaceae bacterium]
MTTKSCARLVFVAVLLSVGLAACFETVSPDPKPASASSRSAKTAKSAPAAALATANAAEQVRQRIRSECGVEVGGLFGADDKGAKQCDCYANAVVKALRTEDFEYYLTYNIVPTLTITKPDDLKKACGISVAGQSGRPPSSETR